MSRILLVEDDETLGQTLKERLEREGHRTVLTDKIESAHSALQATPFDLVILDVGLPDGSGFEFAKKAKSFCESPFMFVTAQASAKDRLQGFELGAEEFIPKPFHLKEFLMRVRHVLKVHTNNKKLFLRDVEIHFDSRIIIHKHKDKYKNNHKESQKNNQKDKQKDTAHKKSSRYFLSNKEFEILKWMVEQSPMVVSREEILEKFWEANQSPSNRTIDNIILNLRQKLGPLAGEYIHSVRGVGYQWMQKEELPDEQ